MMIFYDLTSYEHFLLVFENEKSDGGICFTYANVLGSALAWAQALLGYVHFFFFGGVSWYTPTLIIPNISR